MNVILLRHGKTPSNIRGAFTGTRDEPLSEQGISELDGRRYPEVSAVFSSPMRRCVETARLIYPGHAPVIVEGLRERNFGDFEGLTHSEIIALPGFSNWGMNEEGMVFPNGEDIGKFAARCVPAFRETIEQAEASGTQSAAIVCHGGVIMTIMSAMFKSEHGYFHWLCGNGCGYSMEFREGKLSLKGSIGG